MRPRLPLLLALSAFAALLFPISASALDPGDVDASLPTSECNDLTDNDGDGLNNLEDPGCRNRQPTSQEAPECDDDADNDGDDEVDFDGGALEEPVDTDCQTSWWDDEGISRTETGHPALGNGGTNEADTVGCRAEIIDLYTTALVLPLFWVLRRRRK